MSWHLSVALLEYEFSVLKPKTEHIRMDATETNSTDIEVIANVNSFETKALLASPAEKARLSKKTFGATALIASFSQPIFHP